MSYNFQNTLSTKLMFFEKKKSSFTFYGKKEQRNWILEEYRTCCSLIKLIFPLIGFPIQWSLSTILLFPLCLHFRIVLIMMKPWLKIYLLLKFDYFLYFFIRLLWSFYLSKSITMFAKLENWTILHEYLIIT